MAVILNKNSFWLHSQLTAFCIKNNPRENRFFLRQVDDWRTGKALIMLKFLPKTIQKTTVSQTRTWANGTKKHVRLLPSARAVARHAAHDPRRQNYGNAEVTRRWQAVFGLWKIHWITSARVLFWYIIAFCHGQMGINLWSYRIFVLCCIHGEECLSWFWHTKIKHSSQFKEKY